jgi:hypothetical protein
MTEILHKFFICVGNKAKGPHMEYFGIEKGSGVRFDIMDESPKEILRPATTCTHKYSASSTDVTEDSIL